MASTYKWTLLTAGRRTPSPASAEEARSTVTMLCLDFEGNFSDGLQPSNANLHKSSAHSDSLLSFLSPLMSSGVL